MVDKSHNLMLPIPNISDFNFAYQDTGAMQRTQITPQNFWLRGVSPCVGSSVNGMENYLNKTISLPDKVEP